jgi:hypothetical protein
MSLGGALALPFAKLVEQAAEANGISAKRAFRKWMGDEKWADRILYGLPQEAGINLSNNVSTGEMIPEFDQAGVNPIAKMAGPLVDYAWNRRAKAVEVYKTQDNPLIAAEIAAPRFARGLLKAGRAALDGDIKSYRGETLVPNATPGEIASIAMGFTPTRLAKANEFVSERYKLDERASFSPKDYNTLIAEALSSKDIDRARSLIREIATYNASVPESQRITPSSTQIKSEIIAKQEPLKGMFKSMPKKAWGDLTELLSTYGKLDRGGTP